MFWYNFAGEYKRSGFEVLSSVYTGYFTTYTPTLWYLVTTVAIGWLGGMCFERSWSGRDVRDIAWEPVGREGPDAPAARRLVAVSPRGGAAGALSGVSGP